MLPRQWMALPNQLSMLSPVATLSASTPAQRAIAAAISSSGRRSVFESIVASGTKPENCPPSATSAQADASFSSGRNLHETRAGPAIRCEHLLYPLCYGRWDGRLGVFHERADICRCCLLRSRSSWALTDLSQSPRGRLQVPDTGSDGSWHLGFDTPCQHTMTATRRWCSKHCVQGCADALC